MANPQGIPLANQPFVDSRLQITQAWRQFLVSLWQRSGGSTGGNVFVSGDVKSWPGATAPDGWIICDGQAISRALYAGLFAVIGTTWGPGDGSTTFNVPDFRGRALVGANGTTINVGDTGGAASVTLSVGQLPSHTHGITDPAHSHGITDPTHNHESAFGAENVTTGTDPGGVVGGFTLFSATGISINPATTGITVDNTGSGDAVPTQSPYAGVLHLIKA